MASISIQGRIDGELWEGLKLAGETNTQLLQRLAAHYRATSAEKLADIAPTPDAAVAVLLRSHSLLDQMVAGGGVVGQPVQTETSETVQQPTEEDKSAIDCADDW